jgi:S-layer homology domain
VTTFPRFAVLVLASVALAAPALAQIPPMLSEFQVNVQTYYYQECNGVAIDKVGRFVVAWSGYDETVQGDLAFGRLYDQSGSPETGEFPFGPPNGLAGGDVPTGFAGQSEATVAKDASGRFVAVWQEGADVFARRFDADATPLGDAFQVNESTSYADSPQVDSDDSGNFVIVWTATGTTDEVAARVFNSHGAPVTGEFVVNAYTTDTQDAGGVAMYGGGFVVSWGGEGAGGPGIFARIFDAAGAPLGGDFKVNEGFLLTAVSQSDVAMDAIGSFVVVWPGFVAPSSEGIFARRYNPAGFPLSGDLPVSEAANDSQGGAHVKSDHAGNFIVAWTHQAGDGDGSGIVARRYNRFGQPVTPAFVVNEGTDDDQYHANVALNDAGDFVVTWSSPDDSYYGVFGRRSGVGASSPITVAPVTLGDANAPVGNLSSVIEPGESVRLETAWVNHTGSTVAVSGTATGVNGPAGTNVSVTLDDALADYGMITADSIGPCNGTGDCYEITVSDPAVRTAGQHWDAQLHETLSVGVPHTWVLHIGESFPDVPTDNIFYAFIETLFHNGVTGGCAGGGYCPTNPVTRAQMAVFLLKARFGSAHIPPPCTGTVFTDVPCTGGPFDPWIEELASLGITGGCGGGLYCPANTVTRQQMAVFLLKALEGSAYVPPACTGIFDDVPCTPGTGFSDWIEELFDRGITGGCSVTPPLYCPTNPNNRGQMAAFLTKMFQLVLYGG